MRVSFLGPWVLLTVAAPAWAQTSPAQTDPAGTTETTSGGTSAESDAPPPAPPEIHHHHHAAPAPPPPVQREDGDGRAADILWIEGAFGYSYVNLVQFSHTEFLPQIDRYKGGGYMAALAAGVRLSFLMIGARGTLSSYEWFDLWSIGGEVHLRIPVAAVEPYARIGAGYAFVGQADYDVPEMSEQDVFGLMLDAGAGIDIYLDQIFAIGAGLDVAWLNLSRQRVDMDGCMEMTCGTGTIDFTEDGDAAGLQLRLHGHASLHF